MTAEEILNKSELLVKSNCIIVDDVLYERLQDASLNEFFSGCCDVFRFFISDDHYDYVEDEHLLEMLAKHFES